MRDVDNQSRLLDRAWLTAFAILLGLAGYLSNYKSGPVPLKAEFSTFPVSLRHWSGQEGEPQKVAFRVRGADHELVRKYRSSSGRQIELYVAYFESQHQSKEIVNYLTARLHRKATVANVSIEPQGVISINQVSIKGQQGMQHLSFWYDLNGSILADRYKAKFATTLDALIHGRTNGAFVVLAGNFTNRDEEEKVMKEHQDLIRELLPVLRSYLP